jgi:hypothetical protein
MKETAYGVLRVGLGVRSGFLYSEGGLGWLQHEQGPISRQNKGRYVSKTLLFLSGGVTCSIFFKNIPLASGGRKQVAKFREV